VTLQRDGGEFQICLATLLLGAKQNGMQHMMAFAPADADLGEARYLAKETRQHLRQRSEAFSARDLHFQDHDRDDDRDYAVDEGLLVP
jgi:hypothetical protein